ncbi:porin [Salinicola endophyticus]|uniref:Porin n=1 Tax=Salinicola endophyticus TaxID=1949083 RepID=A0ABY8FBN0_9GAMM|nr:porin [Salinicola endophyticus]WFF40216.1 porin [Salinicola endophyticus]
MKKTLLATAIAGALGASAAAQAATVYNQDGTQLDIYGNIQIAYKSIETGSYDSAGRITGSDSQDELFDNGSTVGFSGQHVINPGLTGYFKAEFEHKADEEKIGNGLGNGDQAYLGLKGNFGDARLGSWDPLIDDWVQDPISNNEYFDNTDSTRDLGGLYGYASSKRIDREGDKFQYMSPVWAGLQFAIGTQYKGDADWNGSDADFDVAGYEHRGGSNASFFGGLKYAVGAFSVAAVYDDLNNYKLQNTTTGDYSEAKAYGVTAQYTIDTLRLAAKVEDTDMKVDGESGDIMRYAVGARYGYALSDNFAGDLYGSYQYVDADKNVAIATNRGAVDSAGNYAGDDNFNEFILGATYNISPAMYTFVEGALYDRTHDVGNGVAVGAVYSF